MVGVEVYMLHCVRPSTKYSYNRYVQLLVSSGTETINSYQAGTIKWKCLVGFFTCIKFSVLGCFIS